MHEISRSYLHTLSATVVVVTVFGLFALHGGYLISKRLLWLHQSDQTPTSIEKQAYDWWFPPVPQSDLDQAIHVLSIPSIDIKTPIILDVPTDNKTEYNRLLRNGVGLAKDSTELEADQGNSFIFGHSSRLVVQKSPYDAIFANLSEVKIDDQVIIETDGERQEYTVFFSEMVEADDQSVLDDTDTKIVTLMTCWPLNTDAKRWIVQAKKV